MTEAENSFIKLKKSNRHSHYQKKQTKTQFRILRINRFSNLLRLPAIVHAKFQNEHASTSFPRDCHMHVMQLICTQLILFIRNFKACFISFARKNMHVPFASKNRHFSCRTKKLQSLCTLLEHLKNDDFIKCASVHTPPKLR